MPVSSTGSALICDASFYSWVLVHSASYLLCFPAHLVLSSSFPLLSGEVLDASPLLVDMTNDTAYGSETNTYRERERYTRYSVVSLQHPEYEADTPEWG